MPIAFIYDPIFLRHDTGDHHPESIDRLHSILDSIEPVRDSLYPIAPEPATTEQLSMVHTEAHIESVRIASMSASPLDGDTMTSQDSYQAALKAAGAGIRAVDAINNHEVSSAFCAVRPPGHHATSSRAMGFCLFNSIAVTARYAQAQGYNKIFIIDFDVHHGNGTQDIFYSDPSIFYFSTHQYPAYPGTGSDVETGSGAGIGFTCNAPLTPYSNDDDILPIYEEELPKIVDGFRPDLILVSAGYDLHASDPLASLNVSTDGVATIVDAIMRLSDVPKIFMLEGGYNLDALGECVQRTLRVMMDAR